MRRIVTLSLNGSPVALGDEEEDGEEEEGEGEEDEDWDMMLVHEASKVEPQGNKKVAKGVGKGKGKGKSTTPSNAVASTSATTTAPPVRRSSRSRSSSLVPTAPTTSTSTVPTSSSFNYQPPEGGPSYGSAGETLEAKEVRFGEMVAKVDEYLFLSKEQRETWVKIARDMIFGVSG